MFNVVSSGVGDATICGEIGVGVSVGERERDSRAHSHVGHEMEDADFNCSARPHNPLAIVHCHSCRSELCGGRGQGAEAATAKVNAMRRHMCLALAIRISIFRLGRQ